MRVFVLQGAINLVRHGEYAMRSSEGFRVLDQPLVANGPGIILLIAGVFYLFGIGLMQARLTVAVIMVLTAIIYFILAKRMFGIRAAFLSTFMFLAIPQEGLVWFGRMVMGNVPALACILAGFYFWIVSIEKKKWKYKVGAGFFLGLAMVIKAQTAIILPTFLMVAIIDWYYYKHFEITRYLVVIGIPILFFIVWNLAQFAIVGTENYSHHLAAIQSSTRVTILMFRPGRIYAMYGTSSIRAHQSLFFRESYIRDGLVKNKACKVFKGYL